MRQNTLDPAIYKFSFLLGFGLLLATSPMGAQTPRPPVESNVQQVLVQHPLSLTSMAGTPTSLTARQRAWQTLLDGLAEKSAEKRANAVSALGLLSGSTKAEKAAREGLKDEKYNVRAAAATALGSMHAVRSVPNLEIALEDEEPMVVLASANSLLLLKDNGSAYAIYYGVLTGTVRPSKGLIREQMRTLHDTKKMAELGFEEGIGFVPFAGVGYGVVKAVRKSESDPSAVRAAAAKKLAHDPNPASAEALVAATHDSNWIVRAAALEAIAERGDRSLLPRIISSMDDTKDHVRYTAASCVLHLSGPPHKQVMKGGGSNLAQMVAH